MNRIFALLCLSCLALVSPADAAPRPPVEYIGQPFLHGASLPFSEAVRVGDILFLSGQIGRKSDGMLPVEFDAQARQVMDNIGRVLATAGVGWGDVVKCSVMLDDMANWPAFNKIYVTYFKDGKFPARSAFGADGLALSAALEVECIAHSPAK